MIASEVGLALPTVNVVAADAGSDAAREIARPKRAISTPRRSCVVMKRSFPFRARFVGALRRNLADFVPPCIWEMLPLSRGSRPGSRKRSCGLLLSLVPRVAGRTDIFEN